MTSKPYRIKSFSKGRSWEVIGPMGLPVYDNEPYGKDKPLIFKDEDTAQDFADRLNSEFETESA